MFNHPSRYLKVRPGSVRVDRMGIKAEEGASGQVSEIASASITLGDRPPFEAILASYDRADMAASSGAGLFQQT